MNEFSLLDVLESLSQDESSNDKLTEAAVLDAGYGFRRFMDLPLDRLKTLLHPSVLLSSSCPWRLCLELSRECDRIRDKSCNEDWLKVSYELETLAMKTVELHEYVMDADETSWSFYSNLGLINGRIPRASIS